MEPSNHDRPDVSFVMPCYNEEAMVAFTIPRLVTAFERAGHRLQLVAVDNGSQDRTGEKLEELRQRFPAVEPMRVPVNRGYGYGILQGLTLCRAPWIGIIPADGQVDAEDVVRLFEAAQATNGWIVAKVRRRFRMDGVMRKVVSVSYNLFARLLWPRLGTIDLNGTPKLLPRELLAQLDLRSHDWLLDPEIIIKSHYLGARVLEFNAFGRMRGNGLSHVRASTVWQFFVALLRLRFSRELPAWRRSLTTNTPARPLDPVAAPRE
ncbi:MAG TPA: glycosyltransferase family 2 protein [Gemmatimonadaceae bacterium]